MSKKNKIYIGDIEDVVAEKIIINIKHLQDGNYILFIMNNNETLKEVHFKKITTKR